MKLGRGIIEQLQHAGIAACGKHFPGHGDTAADSHEELPIVESTLDLIDGQIALREIAGPAAWR